MTETITLTNSARTEINTDKKTYHKVFAFYPTKINETQVAFLNWVYYSKKNGKKIYISAREYEICRLKTELEHIYLDIDLLKNNNLKLKNKKVVLLNDQYLVKQNSGKISNLIYEKYKILSEIELIENSLNNNNLLSKTSKRVI